MSDQIPTAKQVAKALDQRQRRRKVVMLLALAAIIAAIIVYGTCGRGWGLGKGEGDGSGSGPGQVVDAAPQRCQILVRADGIIVNGAPTAYTEAIAACKGATSADVIVTGDAREGDWKQLEAALTTAKIEVFVRK